MLSGWSPWEEEESRMVEMSEGGCRRECIDEEEIGRKTTTEERRAQPKRSEPLMRKLWTLAHRVVEPRTLGWMVQHSSAFKESVFCYNLKESRQIALTIDDAPSEPRLMKETLQVLASFGVKATFFAVESFARMNLERLQVLKQCVEEGHELGNHMVEDKSSVSMSRSQFLAALLKCEELIEQCDPGYQKRRRKWFRPPHGYMNLSMSKVLNYWNYIPALADVFPLDTEVRSVDWLVDFVLHQVKPGSIILLHAPDIRKTRAGKMHRRQNNVAVLAKLIPKLLERDFVIGTLSDLADAALSEKAEAQLLRRRSFDSSSSSLTTTASLSTENADNHDASVSSSSSILEDDEPRLQESSSRSKPLGLKYAASI